MGEKIYISYYNPITVEHLLSELVRSVREVRIRKVSGLEGFLYFCTLVVASVLYIHCKSSQVKSNNLLAKTYTCSSPSNILFVSVYNKSQ
jgi:hypothetical protein